MLGEQQSDVGKLDILALTHAYLNGKIAFEVYYDLERQWYDRLAQKDLLVEYEETLKELAAAIDNSRVGS
jgi:hypothetical protein